MTIHFLKSIIIQFIFKLLYNLISQTLGVFTFYPGIILTVKNYLTSS